MNSLASSESFAATFLSLLWEAAWQSSLLLLLALVTTRCMGRCTAAARHFTLLLAVGSLLLLPLLSRTLPRLEVLPPWMEMHGITASARGRLNLRSTAQAGQSAAANAAVGSESQPSSPAQFERTAVEPRTARERVAPPHTGNRSFWTWAPAVWAIGVLCVFAPAAAGWLSLWRLQRALRGEEPSALRGTLEQLSLRAGVRRRIRLLVARNRQMPMTWGLLTPKVLLPAHALEWPEERRRVVLLHELAHIRRGDFATVLLTRFVCALYWFNPLVWLAARRLRLEQEQACDDAVLQAGAQPSGYAEDVLHIAAGPVEDRIESFGALAMARPSTLETRLLAILDGSRSRASLTRIGVVMTAGLTAAAVIPLSMLRASQEPAARATGAPAVAAAEPKPDRGLVAWWRAEGDGKDSAGHHDGEFPFGIRYLPGRIGQAFDFRRSFAIEDILPRVSIPDSPDFQLSETLTLEAWIFPVRFGGIVLLRGDDRPGYDTWQVDLLTPGKISFNFDDAENKSAEILAPLELGKWQHMAAIFDRGVMKLYLDGVLAAEAQTKLRPNPILDPRHTPALGIGNTGGKRYSIPFDGLIDEVKIYNRALSAAEVAESSKK